AIDASFDGDTVLVADDIYTGTGNRDLDFMRKAILLQSENGPAGCIIDCQGAGRGFDFHSGEGKHSVLDGFTITNGLGDSGGGIACYSSSPTIRNCIISNNEAQDDGGGMYCYSNASPLLLNCIFTGNTAHSFGGGIHNYFWAAPTVTRCIFIDNSADTGGGGMYNRSNAS
ncbi:MAG: DUF1565 domain-containing protein, partial [Planctomycetes bacterium]|nr:DUF1565 domain-containing protein [Planctomycetota bacterium]